MEHWSQIYQLFKNKISEFLCFQIYTIQKFTKTPPLRPFPQEELSQFPFYT